MIKEAEKSQATRQHAYRCKFGKASDAKPMDQPTNGQKVGTCSVFLRIRKWGRSKKRMGLESKLGGDGILLIFLSV